MQNSEDIQRTVLFYSWLCSCGLMQNSEDIQPLDWMLRSLISCGLMQNSEDIQRQSHTGTGA